MDKSFQYIIHCCTLSPIGYFIYSKFSKPGIFSCLWFLRFWFDYSVLLICIHYLSDIIKSFLSETENLLPSWIKIRHKLKVRPCKKGPKIIMFFIIANVIIMQTSLISIKASAHRIYRWVHSNVSILSNMYMFAYCQTFQSNRPKQLQYWHVSNANWVENTYLFLISILLLSLFRHWGAHNCIRRQRKLKAVHFFHSFHIPICVIYSATKLIRSLALTENKDLCFFGAVYIEHHVLQVSFQVN